MSTDKLNFKLEIFDGPLDLLLTLISKQKINIYDIPISEILDQYLEYIELAEMNNAELSSEFIVMACELLYIKSKMLLPKEEEEEDPRDSLVKSLIEYSKVREAAQFLALRAEDYFFRYYPTPKAPVVTIETVLYDKSLLLLAYKNLKAALKEEKEQKKRNEVEGIFSARVASVEGKVVFILKRLVKALPYGNSVSFNSIIMESGTKSDMVASFLAMLRLIGTGRISFTKVDKDYIISLNR